jgi:hypothetical protein
MGEAGSDFFISYTKDDRAWAEWVSWQLEDAGHSVMLDVWDFRPADAFVARMHREVDRAARIMPILSDNYFVSQFGEA